MTDIEKVINGIRSHIKGIENPCANCPYYELSGGECFPTMLADALKLLEERKPVKAEMEGHGPYWHYVCGECHTKIGTRDKYCHECGSLVDWNG